MKFYELNISSNIKKPCQENLLVDSLAKSMAFQVYLDLNLLRGRKLVKIFYKEKENLYFIISFKNNGAHRSNELEIFIPMPTGTMIDVRKICKIFDMNFIVKKKLVPKAFNLAMIDLENNIVYYKIDRSLHVTTGPVV